jgi:triphosphoribosyl-dephospho-CoA synthetase
MYKYNIFVLKDMFNHKLFRDKYKIGNLKRFLGVKTQKEADAYVEKLVAEYMEFIMEHLITGDYMNFGSGFRMYIKESVPELRHIRREDNINIICNHTKWLKKMSSKMYTMIPKLKLKKMIASIFNETTGISWKLQHIQS